MRLETKLDLLEEIAEKHGLSIIETTSKSNGYPSNLKYALVGFSHDQFELARELANEHILSLEFFTKKDGWDLWFRTGNQAYEPMKGSSEDYGENYSEIHYGAYEDEQDFLDNYVLEIIRNNSFTSLKDMEIYVEEMKKLWEAIECLEEGQILITREGYPHEIVQVEQMYHYHDTKHIIIGLI